MKENIVVLLKKWGEKPEVRMIPNDMKAIQGIVDGIIEVVQIRNNVVMICNEEHKTRSKFYDQDNFLITSGQYVIDRVKGNAVICSTDGEDFDDLDSDAMLDIFDELSNPNPTLEVKFT